MRLGRRAMLGGLAALGPTARLAAQPSGPFTADWSSLTTGYRMPDWFRDAKFGIWAHWGPQSVPEQGDWYGRLLYMQGHPMADYHRATYGHPADFGMMEVMNRWTAAHWDPGALMARYKQAGAQYFVALACHHDNLDCYDSAHHPWNSLRVGPKRDVVGEWAEAARAAGLRFGVSNHASHAWHWYQTAYGYDAEGARAGERYDAFRLTRADGTGKWWDGLDPQTLYTGAHMPAPTGIRKAAAMNAWHDANDGQWVEHAPPNDPSFAARWLARQTDLVAKYRPDFVYFDNHGVPFGETGLRALADYYNRASEWNGGGSPQVVATLKALPPWQRAGVTEDIERGAADGLRALPWQTGTCLGDWFYNAARPRDRSYKSAESVIQTLADVVSKNGNLLLSVPQRGDGTIDAEEEAIIARIGAWLAANGNAIFKTRPWRVFGEGPTRAGAGPWGETAQQAYTAHDIRFTTHDDTLYALLLGDRASEVTIRALANSAAGTIERVTLIGGPVLAHRRDNAGLHFTVPRGTDRIVPVLRIEGRGLTG